MISWSSKRQLNIMGIIVALIIIIGLIYYFSNKEPANCFDGLLNQNETGVDCGGSCLSVCQDSAEDVAVLWSRVVPVTGDVYSVVAMLENPNLSFEAKDTPYTFKLYDSRNILIYERKGSALILPGKVFPIFEHALRTGERVPARATFEFRQKPFWEKALSKNLDIKIISTTLDTNDNSPKLTSIVKNKSFKDISNIKFIALLFDVNDNLVNASQTILEDFIANETRTLSFTWPEGFSSEVIKIDVVPVEYN